MKSNNKASMRKWVVNSPFIWTYEHETSTGFYVDVSLIFEKSKDRYACFNHGKSPTYVYGKENFERAKRVAEQMIET